jgi:hypothetical protein
MALGYNREVLRRSANLSRRDHQNEERHSEEAKANSVRVEENKAIARRWNWHFSCIIWKASSSLFPSVIAT